ncbi:hypothetical protein [Tropicibacter naphthalenivorans]|nr:hypothetical protein [Tropicibacter naphthalenivorans]
MTLTPETGNPHCQARLEGLIENGDLPRLVDGLRDAQAANQGHLSVCLDSPGGSFLEGSRIAAFIEDNRIGTVIDDGDQCRSACSLIFMLGAADQSGARLTSDIGDNRVLLEFNRKMHINATLGFHRPAATLNTTRSYSAAEMESAFRIAIDSALEFMRIANRWKASEGASAMKPDLIENLLQHEGSEDFFYIDTVDKAGRYDIEVFGYSPPSRLSAVQAMNVCDNASNWVAGLAQFPVVDAAPDTLAQLTFRQSEMWTVAGPRTELHPVYYVRGRDIFHHRAGGGGGERVCQVAFRPTISSQYGNSLSVSACGGDGVLGQSFGEFCHLDEPSDAMTIISQLSIYPSDTKLSELEAVSRQIETNAAEIERALMPAATYKCSKDDGSFVSVVTRGEALPIRQTEHSDSDVIAYALPFTRLPRGDSAGRVIGSDEQRTACLNACQAERADPSLQSDGAEQVKATLDACFKDNLLRWSVTLPDGQIGWASAFYLR